VAALHAAEFEGVDVGRPAPYRGLEGAALLMSESLEAFPDLYLVQEGVVIEGEHAILVWTARGTHKGKLMRIPPTGREICVRGVSALTIKDGEITRGLYIWDTAGLLRNIGLLPEL
jgi:predicted ester cyclase